MKKLEPNVKRVLDWCTGEVGKFYGESFNIDIWTECDDFSIESPIEKILYCAIKALMVFNGIEKCEPLYRPDDTPYQEGLHVWPQYQGHGYRVDFLISNYFHFKQGERQRIRKLIVECDSQEFHERDESERRYEKERDRIFQKIGYKTFHYTGKEILINPYKIAAEIISQVMDIDKDELLLNSNTGK